MTSSRPYLVRAIHEWLVDNGFTPQLVVDANVDGVVVPRHFVKDGMIVLNTSPQAVRGLMLGNEQAVFDARFGGTPHHVVVPMQAIRAVMARENGAGMSFPDDDSDGEPPEDPSDGEHPDGSGRGPGKTTRPSLRVVK